MPSWCYPIVGGPQSLAERSDGVVLTAGSRFLDAISPGGKRIRRIRLTRSRAGQQGVGVIVDARGTAYVGGADGAVLVVFRGRKMVTALNSEQPLR